MLSQTTPKPHRIKWVEAERALAVQGIVFPSYPSSPAELPERKEHPLPSHDKTLDSDKK